MDLERKCSNCTYYPCLRLECTFKKVCGQHEFEHEEMIKEIDKKGREEK